MKVCIFGASGYIGESVYIKLKENPSLQTIGTYLESEEGMQYEHFTKLDVNDPESFSTFYKEENPDVVVWSVLNGPKEHELTDQGLMHLITHLTPETKLVYVSTDLVFADGNGPYKPDDRISKLPNDHFLSVYANAKVKAERLIDNELINYAILRTGPVYGQNAAGKWDELLHDLFIHVREGKTVSYRDDLVRTFTPIEQLTKKIVQLVNTEQTGIFHVGEKEGRSFYHFMRSMAIERGDDPSRIKKSLEEEEPDHKLPKNTSLVIE